MPKRCSAADSETRESNGGADGSRTHDLLNAIQALSQLSYGPTERKMAGIVDLPVPHWILSKLAGKKSINVNH